MHTGHDKTKKPHTEYSLTHIVLHATSIISELDGENARAVFKNTYDFQKKC